MSRVAGVMAGGGGTRLRGLGASKSLVTVGSVALVDHVFAQLLDAGVNEVVIDLREDDDALRTHVEMRRAWFESVVTVSAANEGGTGAAVRALLDEIGDRECLISTVDTVAPPMTYARLWDDARATLARGGLARIAATQFIHDEAPIWVSPDEKSLRVLDLGKEIAPTGLCFGNVRWLSQRAIPIMLEVVEQGRSSDIRLMRRLLAVEPDSIDYSQFDPIFDIDDETDVEAAERWINSGAVD